MNNISDQSVNSHGNQECQESTQCIDSTGIRLNTGLIFIKRGMDSIIFSFTLFLKAYLDAFNRVYLVLMAPDSFVFLKNQVEEKTQIKLTARGLLPDGM